MVVARKRMREWPRHRGVDLGPVEIHVITSAVLRLDLRSGSHGAVWETNQAAAAPAAAVGSPGETSRHRRNHAGEVAELLAYFRSLQRQLELSVLLVHHTRKNAAGE